MRLNTFLIISHLDIFLVKPLFKLTVLIEFSDIFVLYIYIHIYIYIYVIFVHIWTSQVTLLVKNPPANAGDIKDVGLIPGSGRFHGGGYGHPLQYSNLENPMDREAWQTTLHRVAQSDSIEMT